MHLSLVPVQTFQLQLCLTVPDGVATTIFLMSERWLAVTSDRQMAVTKVSGRCKAENFRSLMDYLFANVFPGTYWLVMDYYADEGPPLREILTKKQCDMIDCLLVEALKLAYQDFCEDRERSWSRVRRTSDARYFRSVG